MEALLAILALLTLVAALILGALFLVKRSKTTVRQMIGPFSHGARRRDGAVSYDEYRGMRFNVELEDPRGSESLRYQRRHALGQQHKQAKPWMK